MGEEQKEIENENTNLVNVVKIGQVRTWWSLSFSPLTVYTLHLHANREVIIDKNNFNLEAEAELEIRLNNYLDISEIKVNKNNVDSLENAKKLLAESLNTKLNKQEEIFIKLITIAKEVSLILNK